MTIRDLLKAQMVKARIIGFVFWLLLVAGYFLPKDSPYHVLLLLPAIGFACTVIYTLFFIKCPKCGTKLGQAISKLNDTNFCPSCGVSLDTTAPV
jgi:rRNA maturation protein Nop10